VNGRSPRSLSEVVACRPIETGEGFCHHARLEYPVTYRYGGAPLGRVREVGGPTLVRLARDEHFAGLSLERACFIDTETTGLAGGTGTHVFLVGVGYFQGDWFVVDQYFMDDYDQEPALTAVLEDSLSGFEAVVSFNGKAFDLPLLEARFIMARRRSPLLARPHLDLLHPARRLWGRRLVSCRLAALEEAVLEEPRTGDLPGWLVPQRYFDYLRTRDARAVKPIFDHNRLDVLSLAALAAHAAGRFEAFLDDPPREEVTHPLDLYGLARYYRSEGLAEAAVRCYTAFLDEDLPEDVSRCVADRAGLDCVRLLRRLGRTGEAMELARKFTDGHPPRLWAMVELAKDLEHRLGDHEGALSVVDRALGLLEARSGEDPGLTDAPPSPSGLTPKRAALEWRRRRLERKRRLKAGSTT